MNISRKFEVVKTLAEWPISKVQLISQGENLQILKEIHIDFAAEIDRQIFLSQNLKSLKVPRIYGHWKTEEKAIFLMEYVESIGSEINDSDAISIIQQFHQDTAGLKDTSFKSYTSVELSKNIESAEKYLDKKSIAQLKEMDFTSVFNGHHSIVHGDWGKDQIINSKLGIYIIDFGRSFYGPSILDFAYYCKDEDSQDLQICEITRTEIKKILTAKIIVNIMQIAWFDLCKRKYIDCEYTKEFSKINKTINNLLKKYDS